MKNKVIIGQTAALITAVCLFPINASAAVRGDVNGDGTFSAADLVAFSQYIMGSGEVPKSLGSGDLYSDNVLDVFDVIMMRKELIKNLKQPLPMQSPVMK